MPSLHTRSQMDELLSLDARTRELIAFIEKMPSDLCDVRNFREQLDIYQDEIKGNISLMSSILSDLQINEKGATRYLAFKNLQSSAGFNTEQLSFLQDQYRKAVFKAVRHLEVMERECLVRRIPLTDLPTGANDLDAAYETSLELTRDMTSCARRLAEEVRLGAANTELLEGSSTQIKQNLNEIKDMSGHMNQSRRLTSLAYKRRLTSYVLYFLAFTFYFLSVAAIFLNRIPMGSWLLPSSYL
ncbi:unnamed protein product [Dicrocoelium dendriticum]|nr:unnamed protein product [Dicrocoelium dendriticum]